MLLVWMPLIQYSSAKDRVGIADILEAIIIPPPKADRQLPLRALILILGLMLTEGCSLSQE